MAFKISLMPTHLLFWLGRVEEGGREVLSLQPQRKAPQFFVYFLSFDLTFVMLLVTAVYYQLFFQSAFLFYHSGNNFWWWWRWWIQHSFVIFCKEEKDYTVSVLILLLFYCGSAVSLSLTLHMKSLSLPHYSLHSVLRWCVEDVPLSFSLFTTLTNLH